MHIMRYINLYLLTYLLTYNERIILLNFLYAYHMQVANLYQTLSNLGFQRQIRTYLTD